MSERCALRQHSRKPLSPVWSNLIEAEIEVSQRCALPQHSCKALCPFWSDLIPAEIEVSQSWTLRKHSYKALCPSIADPIAAEIEMIQRCALPQHSCNVLEFSVGAFLSRMCFPCGLTLNSMFAEYAPFHILGSVAWPKQVKYRVA